MFGINKNGTKHKIGIIMPAFFPASRTTYDGTTSGLSATRVQGAIDAVEGQIANSSDAYSASKAYSVGDYCIYNDTLYRCVTACSAASWSVNSSCFVADTVVNALFRIETVTVTTGAGSSIDVRFTKFGKVVMVKFFSGTYTTSVNGTMINIPAGYTPAQQFDIRESYGQKRIQGGTANRENEIYCVDALSSYPVRGSFCYICQ